MKNNYKILLNCPLFEGIKHENLNKLLNCLGAKSYVYKKGETIFAEGEPAKNFGIVLSGAVQIIRLDYYGNRSIVASIEPPQIFGESFAFAALPAMPVDVIAVEDTEVMLIDARNITQACCNACSFHNSLIYNLLNVVARKNILFNQKIEVTSKRSTREKLLTYLTLQAKSNNSRSFTIPYNRQELADYLEVDRSGLSAEISKLRKEGLLSCQRSNFTLLF